MNQCSFYPGMPYRRTENVARKLAARHAAILDAARDLAAEAGMGAVQVAAVAERAGIAAGTVYRYFPSKTELVTALVAAQTASEIAALQRAAGAAPGPLSALSAVIATFSVRALANRRLAFALMAEPVEPELETTRIQYRRALAAAIEAHIRRALGAGYLPRQDAATAALALVGALIEGLIGPLAPPADDGTPARAQAMTLLSLRALGVVDARARGLVVQTQVRAGD
jgi:AcrR family transcriptional regulator